MKRLTLTLLFGAAALGLALAFAGLARMEASC